MIQINIVVSDALPTKILTAGQDTAVCGACTHRSLASGGAGTCYVQLGRGQDSMMRSHLANGSLPYDIAAFAGNKVRLSAYGDPAAVPFFVWRRIADVASSVTGYTHQWRTCDPRFSRYCMASVDHIGDLPAARAKGYRAFVVRELGAAKPVGLVQCPAAIEAGRRTVCSSCMACSGTSSGRRSDITIEAHGPRATKFRSEDGVMS